jgi:hypothetical protein
MRSLRFSLGSLLAFVVIAAVDLAMTLTAIGVTDLSEHVHGDIGPKVFVLGVPLMAGLLLAYLVIILWGLRRRGECHAFLVGFEIFGWATLFAYLTCFVWMIGRPNLVLRYISSVLSPFSPILQRCAQTSEHTATVIAAAIVSLPMLSIALIGGVLSSRFGVTVVIRSKCRSGNPESRTKPEGGTGPWKAKAGQVRY